MRKSQVAGLNEGNISNSGSTGGKVNGVGSVGGLVGGNYGIWTGPYSAPVWVTGIVSSSYVSGGSVTGITFRR